MRLTLLLFISLGGCATTPASLGRPTPIATYTTVKKPPQIADCLQRTIGPLAVTRAANRADITSRDAPKLSLRIYDNGTVQVHRPIPFEGRTRSSVEACV